MTSSVKTVTLISGDGDEFEISINVAAQSNLIKNMLDNVGVSNQNPHISNVNSVTLAKVIEYCLKHVEHGNHEATVEEGVGANDTGYEEERNKWDARFLKENNDLLYDIIVAAHYMDIKNLLDSSCQAVADMIKGKTPEQIRRTFNIKNDFTPEEEEEIRRENRWAAY